jgi:hypothetical protein
MRKLIVAAAVAACPIIAVQSASAAESPIVLPSLATGEVLLEADGYAVVRTPATSATITTNVHCTGASEAEARRALEARIAQVRAAAAAAGVAPAGVTVRMGPVREAAALIPIDLDAPAAGAESRPERNFAASATIVIQLHDASRAHDLFETLEPAAQEFGGGPVYELADEGAPRREARRRALAAARADAEAYAEAAGMRIVRMLRITERAGTDFAGLLASEREIMDPLGMARWGRPRAAQVETRALVGVDYVLAPR